MKLQEVKDYYKNLSNEALLEHVAEHNDTGFRNEDVAQIIRMGNDESAWSEPMTAEQFIQEMMDSVKEIHGNSETLAEMKNYAVKNGYDIL